MKRVDLKVLAVSFVIVILVALIGSYFTEIGSWYENIKPSITPPNYVFPIVWSVLFFLIALSLYFSWISAGKNRKIVALVFEINLLLNILLIFLFFKLKNPISSFIEIIFLWISILYMILVLRKINKKAAWLLVPYLVWVSFAAVLNFLIAFR